MGNESQGIQHYRSSNRPCKWIVYPHPVSYAESRSIIRESGRLVSSGIGGERVIVGEVEPVYTRGLNAPEWALLNPDKLPIYDEKRGGGYTYYGPGVRLFSPVLNLKNRRIRFSHFETILINWLLLSLKRLGVHAYSKDNYSGAWVSTKYGQEKNAINAWCKEGAKMVEKISEKEREKYLDQLRVEYKVGSVGFYVEKWVSYLGISVNYDAKPEHIAGIQSCSIPLYYGVKSLRELGFSLSVEQIDAAFRELFDSTVNVEHF